MLAVASGIGAKQLALGYFIARSNMLDHTTALAALDNATKLAIGTTASLTDAQAQLEPTTRLLTTVYQNFGDKTRAANSQIAGFADTMAKLQTQYAFADISEVNYAMQYAVPLAKAAGISFNQMAGSLALLSANRGSARRRSRHRILGARVQAAGGRQAENLHGAECARRYRPREDARAAAFGDGLYGAGAGIVLASSGGIHRALDARRRAAARQDGAIQIDDRRLEQFARRQRSSVRDAPSVDGDCDWPAVGGVGRVEIENRREPARAGDATLTTMLASVVTRLADFATAHPTITKYIATFTAIGAAVAVVVGGALLMTGAFFAAISYLPALAAVTGVVSAAMGGLATAAGVAWAAITGPIGLVVGAIARWSVSAFTKSVKHWSSLYKVLRRPGGRDVPGGRESDQEPGRGNNERGALGGSIR